MTRIRSEVPEDYNKSIRCTYFLVVRFKEGRGIHDADEQAFPTGSSSTGQPDRKRRTVDLSACLRSY
ncbi:hypothetical protein LL912_15845 [Niabella sp. CC-SYL272]|uniref:hypothetical protein n=1 Tax=Niabella agricola TaxID=2891571 RepID=UPI001F2E29EF|nr:hypothetical protein [Niabella agricola]MCF3110257.1 hypothetical protein [Niabella agricola]